ncbi:alpha/beta hydrolase family protein [Dictyobacter arantiisoli]|nr:alpha/beta hydrolase [Dictyobacter arantiisoli]
MQSSSSEYEKRAQSRQRLAYGKGRWQYGELYLPKSTGPHPVVILVHGGYWRKAYDLTLMHPLAKNLAQHGYAVWNIEYRRVGNTGGAWPGTFLDVAQATDYIYEIASTYQLDTQRVIAVGHSAGGHLAGWLATRPQLSKESPLATATSPLHLSAVVSLAGVVDLVQAYQLHLSHDAVVELLGDTPAAVPERYAAASPAAHLPLGIPQIVVHGTADKHVPLIVSQNYARKAHAAGDQITYLEVPEADHFTIIDPNTDAWRQTLAAIQMR